MAALRYLPLLLLAPLWAKAQDHNCLRFDAGPDMSYCATDSVRIIPSFDTLFATDAYLVKPISFSAASYKPGGLDFNPPNALQLTLTDDEWSQAIALPFPFCFFGQVYNSCWVGSNGVVSFDNPGQTMNSYNIQGPAPTYSPPDLGNCIMAPWHDMNPSVNQPGQTKSINVKTYGNAPCRSFVVSWFNIPHYSGDCAPYTTYNATQQVVLHETTQQIEIHIEQRNSCSAWNGGQAIEGIQGWMGNQLVFHGVPGRNAGITPNTNTWNTMQSSFMFQPAGTPILPFITWYKGGSFYGTGTYQDVPTNVASTLVLNATWQTCADTLTATDSIFIDPGGGQCQAGFIPLNTGYDRNTQTALPSGVPDPNWHLVKFNGMIPANPPAANVIAPHSAWSAFPNSPSQWISRFTTAENALENTNYPDYFRTSFCVCDTDSVTIQMEVMCDDYAKVFLDGSLIGTAFLSKHFLYPNRVLINVQRLLPPGQHHIDIAVANAHAVAMGLNVIGSVTGSRVQNDTCCPQVGADTSFSDPGIPMTPVSLTYTTSSYGGGNEVSCHGSNNGFIVVTPTGGAAPYHYQWPHDSNLVAPTANGLSAGIYMVTVTDSIGTSVTDTIEITEPPVLVLNPVVVAPSCATASDGSIAANMAGGNPPYSYLWSNGATTATASGLGAGAYSVTVSDLYGCAAGMNFTLSNAAPVNLSTGMDAAGLTLLSAGSIDPYWQLDSTTAFPTVSSAAYSLVPHTNWYLMDSANWLGHFPGASNQAPVGFYSYSRGFWLSQVDASVQLALVFLCDDAGVVVLNGDTVIVKTYPGYASPDSIVLGISTGQFIAGMNTLAVHVENQGSNPTGFALKAMLYSCGLGGAVGGSEPQGSYTPDEPFLYPNPATQVVTIAGLRNPSKLAYKIWDAQGKLLGTGTNPEIQVSAFATGMYLVEIFHGRDRSVLRFTKQ